MSGISDASQVNGLYLGLTALSPTILTVLLIISGIEQNPGPVVEVETTILSHVQDGAETSRREYNVICVVTGFITVVAMLRETGR